MGLNTNYGATDVANTWTATQTFTTAAFSGAIRVPDGASGAPSFAFSSETNTGLYLGVAGIPIGVSGGAIAWAWDANGQIVHSSKTIQFGSSGVLTPDLFLRRAAAATLQLGAADADTNALIVAQTIRSQGLLAGGNSDQAGKDLTVIVSPGKGTGAGGSFIVQTAPAGSTGTTVGTATTTLTVSATATTGVKVASGYALTLGNAATTGLGAGILAALTNASIVITDSAGQAYRIPCII